MQLCHSYPFVTFVVLIVHQFVGRDDGPLFFITETGYPRFSKNWYISSDLVEKPYSSLHRRRSLRN